MTVGTICNREVVITTRDTSIQEAALLMRNYHVGNLIIVEEREGLRFPTGIVTDRDIIVEVIAKELSVESVTVGDVMSFEITVINENAAVIDAIKQMRAKGVRRLPVVADNGSLTGIITLDDLIDLLAEQLKDLVALIGKEQNQESMARE